MPETLEGALRSLYRSYEQNHARYEADAGRARRAAAGDDRRLPEHGRLEARLRLDRRPGGRAARRHASARRPATCRCSATSRTAPGPPGSGRSSSTPPSSSPASRSGAEFRKDAAREIEAFKQAYRLRNPGADVDKLTDADLLREAMNTIGKKGKLGEHIRCVVSVAMLTEGWDANTVTHILGIRPFRSQLLCEQVVGRGLRRRSYAVNPDDRPLRARVRRGLRRAVRVHPRRPARSPSRRTRGRRSRSGRCPSGGSWRSASRSSTATGSSCPTSRCTPTSTRTRRSTSTKQTVALWVENQGVVGAADRGRPRRHPQRPRPADRVRASPRR